MLARIINWYIEAFCYKQKNILSLYIDSQKIK